MPMSHMSAPSVGEVMSRHKKLAAAGFALALVTAACGGDDDTPDDAGVGSSTTLAIETTTEIQTTTESRAESTSTSAASSPSSTDSSAPTSADTTAPASSISDSEPQTSEVAAEDASTTSTSLTIPEAAEAFIEPSEDELIEAVTRSLVDDREAQSYPTSGAELRCVSSSVVEDIGQEKLIEAGIDEDGSGTFDPAALAESDQQLLVSAFLTCVDVENVFASQVSDGGNLDEATARCLAREMNDNGLLEDLIRPSILGAATPGIDEQDASTQDAFLEAFRACLDFEDEMAQGFMQDGVVSESSARCLAARMDEEGLLDRIMRTQLTGVALTADEDVAAQALMLDLARECLTDAEAERLSLG